MIYKVCPVCRQPGNAKTCDCKDTRMLLIDKRLLNVAQKLIDRGFKLASCRVFEMASIKMIELQVQFKGLYTEALFTGAPQCWQVQQYSYATWGNNDVTYTSLVNTLPWGTPEYNLYNVDLAIIELEDWLDNIDPEGLRAVMILSGYDIGQ